MLSPVADGDRDRDRDRNGSCYLPAGLTPWVWALEQLGTGCLPGTCPVLSWSDPEVQSPCCFSTLELSPWPEGGEARVRCMGLGAPLERLMV